MKDFKVNEFQDEITKSLEKREISDRTILIREGHFKSLPMSSLINMFDEHDPYDKINLYILKSLKKLSKNEIKELMSFEFIKKLVCLVSYYKFPRKIFDIYEDFLHSNRFSSFLKQDKKLFNAKILYNLYRYMESHDTNKNAILALEWGLWNYLLNDDFDKTDLFIINKILEQFQKLVKLVYLLSDIDILGKFSWEISKFYYIVGNQFYHEKNFKEAGENYRKSLYFIEHYKNHERKLLESRYTGFSALLRKASQHIKPNAREEITVNFFHDSLLCRIHETNRRYEKLRDIARIGIEFEYTPDPFKYEFWYFIARAYYKKGKYDEALPAYLKALDLEKEAMEEINYADTERFRRQIKMVIKFFAVKRYLIWYALSKTYLKKKGYFKSLDYCLFCLDITPDYKPALKLKANLNEIIESL